MKLSKDTLAIFKNFASINSNLLLKPGTKLSTISAMKNVMSDVTIAETIPSELGIYDLNEFLGAMSLFSDPELDFAEKYINIKEGDANIKFYGADASVLTVPSKSITFPVSDIDFTVTASALDMIRRTASVLRAEDLSIIGDGARLMLQVGDKKNATGNNYNKLVGTTDKSFHVNLKVENLKMLAGDYAVSISSKKISRFKSVATDLVYYVAVEADSTFDA